MTRELARREIDSLDFYLQNHTDDYGEESHTAMMMAIEALSSSEKPNKWIACSDRLPDTLKDVIIAFANEPDEYDIAYLRTTNNKTYIANGSKKEWVSSMGETTYAEYEVDAWMPIIPYHPEIPTGAEGSEE